MSDAALLKNMTGISFDYTNMYGEGKVTHEDIKTLSDKITKAAQAIAGMRSGGEIRGHLSKDGKPEKVLFSQLPYIKEGNINSPESVDKLLSFGQKLKERVDAVVSFGIGGSFLGNKVLFDAVCGEFWNHSASRRKGWPKMYFSGNNVDGARTEALLDVLLEDAKSAGKKYKMLLVVISKSGSTLETMACFMYFLERLKNHSDIVEIEVVAVTDPRADEGETLLHRIAVQNGWETFRVPDGIGGRFSVFSDVGLVTACASGIDIKEFLRGARDMDMACQSHDVFENMALLNATLKFVAAGKYGRDIEVFMPYADNLKSLSEWYIQLLAESLGKENDRSGNRVYYGRTPVVAVGTTDMHAQTQQHQEGKLDKVVQFVKIDKWPHDVIIPDCFPAEKELVGISGVSFGDAINAALYANAAALSSNGRFNATFVLPELNVYYLGAIMYMLALSVAYEGELADVDAFDQPGVEAYKKILKTKLK